MTIPEWHEVVAPALRTICDRDTVSMKNLAEAMVHHFKLTEAERAARLPSGGKTLIYYRTSWAALELRQTGLVEAVARGRYRATDAGRRYLLEHPDGFDGRELKLVRSGSVRDAAGDVPLPISDATPFETMRTARRQIEAALRDDIIDRILQRDAAFFETLVLRVLLAMGYGGGDPSTAEVVGGAGDEDVDIVVRQDPLGLDRVYVQAKRYGRDRTVGPGAVHALAGSLGIFKASKGLLVTTAGFTRAARETAEKVANRVVLLDGDALAALMIRYGVGVRTEETFHIKKVDEDFFLE